MTDAQLKDLLKLPGDNKVIEVPTGKIVELKYDDQVIFSDPDTIEDNKFSTFFDGGDES